MVLVETLIFSFVSLLVYLLIWKPQNHYRGRKLPPGPIRWPIIGSLPAMSRIDKDYPFRAFTGLSSIYGDIVTIGLGVHFTVVLSSIKVMNELLKRPETLQNRYKFLFNEQRTNGKNLGIAWCQDETWNEVRRFTVKKLREFGFGRMGSLDDAVHEEMESFMDHIREDPSGVWRIDNNRLSVISINVLWACVGGYRFDPKSDFVKRHVDLNIEIFEILRPTEPLLVFPFLKVFSEKSGYRRQGEIHRSCKLFMRDLVNDAKLKREGRQEGKAESFVEVFLDEIERNRGNSDTVMTEDQLETVLMDLFLASTDTTSGVMQWLIYYFLVNPKIQHTARAEILQQSEGGTKRTTLSSRKGMPYVVACILETFRNSPVVSTPPARAASSDIMYKDYIIPKGTCLMFNYYGAFHDVELWEDPYVFRPERFLDPSGTSLNVEAVERVPQFGFGKRVCPGESMAMDVLFGFVTSLLSTFSIDMVSGLEPTTKLGPPSLTVCPESFVAQFTPLA